MGRWLPAFLALLLTAPAAPAAAAPSWHHADTVRCRVHWHDGADLTARRVLDLCDDLWGRVTRALDHRPEGRVHVVVRDLEVWANGLTLPEQRRITLWATPLYLRLRGRVDGLPAVLAHELAHVVASDLSDPLAGAVLGSGLRRDGRRNVDLGGLVELGGDLAPFWWVEGGAEFWGELAGTTRWTTAKDMVLRAAVLEHNLLDWHEWTSREDHHGLGGELGYNQGHSFGRYLRTRVDERALAAVGREFSDSPGPVWRRALERITETDGTRLYLDWVARARAAYEDQAAAMGPEVAGSYLALDPRDVPRGAADPALPSDRQTLWEDASEDEETGPGRWDRWQRRRRLARPGTVWVDRLRSSPDGRWLGWTDRERTVLLPLSREQLPPLAGRWLTPETWEDLRDRGVELPAVHGWSFSPGSDRAVVASDRCLSASLGCLAPGRTGVPDLYVVELASGSTRALTQGLRATEPAWSPDGRAIAFVRRVDGQAHLGLLDPDSPEAGVTWLLRRTDGLQVERPRWSPDGRRLVLSLARGDRQDLGTIGRGGDNLRPLTWDEAEDRDPVFGPRGRTVLWSSDRTGVFNLHRLDLASGRVERLTNVRGGAFSPEPLPDGGLLYLYFTSFGFKPYHLAEPAPLEQTRVTLPEPLELARALVPDPAPAPPEPTVPGPWWSPAAWGLGRLSPPHVAPALMADGARVSAGVLVDVQDAPGVLRACALALLGENLFLGLRLDADVAVSPFVEAHWLRFSDHYGATLDADLDPTTPGPQRVLGVKSTTRWGDARGGLGLDLGDQVRAEAWAAWRQADAQRASDGDGPRPLFDRWGAAWSLHLNTLGLSDREGDTDPRGVSVYLEHGWYATDLPDGRWDAVEVIGRPPAAGGLSDYAYHQALLGATVALGLPAPGSFRHTLELHLSGGFVSRNVSAAEELYAGGLHPLHLFRPEVSTSEFSGYEDFSVHGETLLLLGAAWRAPLWREAHLRAGPLYLASVWLQLFSTVGNAWGYDADFGLRPDGTPELHSWASAIPPALRGRPRTEPGTIRRERPILDVARQNGNRLLVDAGAELRLDLTLFERPWDSVVRVAWGFSTLSGRGDVNDDGVLADHFPLDPFTDEVEPPSLRVTVGLGTGFR